MSDDLLIDRVAYKLYMFEKDIVLEYPADIFWDINASDEAFEEIEISRIIIHVIKAVYEEIM